MMTPCPSPEQLTLLLEEQLDGTEADFVEGHVQSCQRCQDTLGVLCSEASPLSPAGTVADFGLRVWMAERSEGDPSPEFVSRLRDNVPRTLDVPSGLHHAFAAPYISVESTGRRAVAGYEILAELGRGGMGVVYKARQTRLGRIVALKMLLAGAHASAYELARFRVEAEAVARLQHPNIVQIFEVGEENGCPYLALEHVEGGSLAQQLKGALPSGRAAAMLVETLARAVHYAHQCGVIHRDLKPANVLLTADGTAKITDFSLAKRLDAATMNTRSGAVLGTPEYMAPEQADGKGVGVAADVYGLGSILYHLLAGRPPFLAQTPLDTLVCVRTEEPVLPHLLQCSLPRDLETICLKCLEKDPGKRYASALELAEDLHRFQAREPIQARPASPWEKGRKWVKRRPALAGLVAVSVLACLALVGVGVGLWYSGRLTEALEDARQQRQRAENERAETEKQRQRAEAERAEADRQRQRAQEFELRVRYVRDMNAGLQQWQEAYLAPLTGMLEEWKPTPAQPLDLRSWEWGYLSHLCHLELRHLRHIGPCFVTALAFSPDGRWLAGAARETHTALVWDVEAGTARALTGHTGPVESVAFHRDSRLLASGSEDGTIRLWDAPAGRPVHILRGHSAGVRGLAFSPDGRYLASASMDCTVRLWDVAQAKPLAVYTGHKDPLYVLAVAFSRDGKQLASGGRGGDIHICALSGATCALGTPAGGLELLRRLRGHTAQVSGLDFSPDGYTLASASEDRTIKLWDWKAGTARATLVGHQAWAYRAAYSPDGRYLASAGDDGTLRLWDPATGREVGRFRGHPLRLVRGAAFHPNGRWLASSANDTVRLWAVAEGPQEVRIFRGHEAPVTRLDFSPDSRTLASASIDKTVRLWDMASGKELRTLRGHSQRVIRVLFRPEKKGTQLFSLGLDGATKFWDSGSGKMLGVLGEGQSVTECAFSPDGRLLASGHRNGAMKVWDVDKRQELLSITAHAGPINNLAFSSDGRQLASSGGDRRVNLWNADTGAAIRTVAECPLGIYAVEFSRDNRRLAIAGWNGMEVWDLVSGHRVRGFRGHGSEVFHIAFSPDGRRLASGGADRTVRVWDIETGLETLSFQAESLSVYTVAFSPDGRYLAAAGPDGTIKVWEAQRLESQ
jgi:WD40 repeat protein/serine/threonine protein kinase